MVQNVTKSIVFEGLATDTATDTVADTVAGSIEEVTEVITVADTATDTVAGSVADTTVADTTVADTVESIYTELDTIETMRVYNRNKREIRNLKRDNLHIKKEVFFSFSASIRELKLEGFSTKKARVEALKALKEKFGMCGYEISLIAFFDAYGVYSDIIAINASRLHKLRSIVKTNDLTRKEVIDLFK